MKQCSVSLIIVRVHAHMCAHTQGNTNQRNTSSPNQKAIIKTNKQKQVLARMWENWNPCALLVDHE